MARTNNIYTGFYAPAWDDIRAPSTAIALQGQQGDPDVDTDGTFLFSNIAVEQVAILYQMPHKWIGTPIRFHCHWSKTTDAAGDVEWEWRYRIFNNNSIPPAWSSWIAATSRSQAVGADQTLLVDGFTEVDMTNMRGSCMVSIQLRRNVDAVDDTYGADARLWEADIHYQSNGQGSEEEYPGAGA